MYICFYIYMYCVVMCVCVPIISQSDVDPFHDSKLSLFVCWGFLESSKIFHPGETTAGGGKIKSDGLTRTLRKTLCATDDPFEGYEDFWRFVSRFPFKKRKGDLRLGRSEKKLLFFCFKDGLFGVKGIFVPTKKMFAKFAKYDGCGWMVEICS